MVSGRSDLVEIACYVKIRRSRAIMINDGDKDVWLPLSLVEEYNDNMVVMPEWLAREKELI